MTAKTKYGDVVNDPWSAAIAFSIGIQSGKTLKAYSNAACTNVAFSGSIASGASTTTIYFADTQAETSVAVTTSATGGNNLVSYTGHGTATEPRPGETQQEASPDIATPTDVEGSAYPAEGDVEPVQDDL
jgi:hypothetical protein